MVDDTYSPITRISRNNLETVERIQCPKWVVLETHGNFSSKEREGGTHPQIMNA